MGIVHLPGNDGTDVIVEHASCLVVVPASAAVNTHTYWLASNLNNLRSYAMLLQLCLYFL
jgi:hypothetical protein